MKTKLAYVKAKAYLLMAYLLFVGMCFGQQDSLLELAHRNDTTSLRARIQLCDLISKTNIEEGKLHLDSAYTSAVFKKDTRGRVLLYDAYFNYYITKGQLDTAAVFAAMGMKDAMELSDQNLEAKSWRNLGVVACEKGNIEKGMKAYMKAKLIYRNIGNKKGEAKMAVNLGGANALVRKFRTAEGYIREGLEYLVTSDDKRATANSYNMLTDVLAKQHRFKEAVEAREKQRVLAYELKDLYQLSVIDQGLGGIYYQMGEQDSSIFYSRKAYNAYVKYNFKSGIAQTALNLAGSFYEKQQHDSALHYVAIGLELAEQMGAMRLVTQGNHLMSLVKQELGMYKGALEARIRFNQLNDSLISSENRKRMDDLAYDFNIKEKEYENKLLKEKEEVQRLQIEKQRNQIIVLIIGALLLIVIIMVVISSRRNKATKKQLELEQKALRAQMNPHFIFNSLNSIQRMFIEGEEDLANDYMGDFGELLRIILENSGESSIALKDELSTIRLYVDLENVRTEGMIDFTLEVDERIDLLNTQVPPLVIQPFIENAIWHGILPKEQKGIIKVVIGIHNPDTLVCTITDNGVGIDHSTANKQKDHRSKGIEITRSRLNVAQAVQIKQQEQGGTVVQLLIPIQR